MRKTITTNLTINNLAVIKEIKKEIKSKTLRLGFLGENGRGKTYISRIFNLFNRDLVNENLNKFIKKETGECKFLFKIEDTKEDINLSIKRDTPLEKIETHYIYHVFNEDYSEKCYKDNYNKNGDIEGIILGDKAVDIDNKNKEIKDKETERKNKESTISSRILEEEQKLKEVSYVKRANNYSNISVKSLKDNYLNNIDRKYEYKIKIDLFRGLDGIPDNLENINPQILLNDQFKSILNNDVLINLLKEEFTLDNIGEEFRHKIEEKKTFVETGLKQINIDALNENDTCPFCEQNLNTNSINLIKDYNKFIKNTENRVKDTLEKSIGDLKQIKIDLSPYNEINTKYSDYKKNYIKDAKDLELISTENLESKKKNIIGLLEKKHNDITKSIVLDTSSLTDELTSINTIVTSNNTKISYLNKQINNNKSQKTRLKVEIINDFIIYLSNELKDELDNLNKLEKDKNTLLDDLKKLKQQQDTTKGKVTETLKKVIQKIFKERYVLNENDFSISLNNKIKLGKYEVKSVLSQGEKTLLTFAYYIAETHEKIKVKEDYKKIFFIIDDPVSSLSSGNKTSVGDIIKELKEYIKEIEGSRYFIFTHDKGFLSYLINNKIVQNSFEIKSNLITDITDNLSVDYISDLMELYCINTKENLEGNDKNSIGNSCRKILETLGKFSNPKISQDIDIIGNYLKINKLNDLIDKSLVHEESHIYSENDDQTMQNLCKNLIEHIEVKYPEQIGYVKEYGQASK